jgi:hypothetical protein
MICSICGSVPGIVAEKKVHGFLGCMCGFALDVIRMPIACGDMAEGQVGWK